MTAQSACDVLSKFVTNARITAADVVFADGLQDARECRSILVAPAVTRHAPSTVCCTDTQCTANWRLFRVVLVLISVPGLM